ncbi:MAG: tetratricopeptide (TPR) repeat protein [Myxococcota bacterium]|jgi:tetratricopeptide (TPR) repeat protein
MVGAPGLQMYPHDKLDWHVSRLENRLGTVPDDVSARLQLATTALSKAWFHGGGEVWFNRALTQARRVIQSDPSSLGALTVAGAALVGLGRTDPAARYLDEAVRLDPESAHVHLALGALHRQLAERHLALRELEIACRLAQDSWEPHAHLGELLWSRHQELNGPVRLLERAQYHLVRALQLGPAPAVRSDLLYLLGITCMHGGRFDDADKLFRALREDPDHRARAQYYLGLVAYQVGRHENAVLYLRQHLRASGESARVWTRIAMASLQLGEVVKAREACNRALALDPGDLQARYTLACAMLEEGRTDEAAKGFREVLKDAPGHVAAFRELVGIRSSARDKRWLIGALRSEVSVFDRLPRTAAPTSDGSLRDSGPRASTRERVATVLGGLREIPGAIEAAILDAMELTSDEGLRLTLWNAALDVVAGQRARSVAAGLAEPGRMYSAARGHEVLALSDRIPPAQLVRGLQIGDDDLRRAAVDRHGPAQDVGVHRQHVDDERREARAWQALLLLAAAAHDSDASRTLLVRWAAEADADLAVAARAGLAMLGDEDAAETLRRTARGRGAAHLVDALQRAANPPRPAGLPHIVTDQPDRVCSTCGRRGGEVHHLVVGGDVAVCDVCMTDIARNRRELETSDPAVRCRLTGATNVDVRAVYVYRGIQVSIDAVEWSLGLREREQIDRFLASWRR